MAPTTTGRGNGRSEAPATCIAAAAAATTWWWLSRQWMGIKGARGRQRWAVASEAEAATASGPQRRGPAPDAACRAVVPPRHFSASRRATALESLSIKAFQ